MDHVTPLLLALLTVAVNCCDCPGDRVTFAGMTLTVIPGGNSVTAAVAVLLGSATLVAVIVTTG